jgi:hypothetical protein
MDYISIERSSILNLLDAKNLFSVINDTNISVVPKFKLKQRYEYLM